MDKSERLALGDNILRTLYKSFIHQELVVHTHTQKNTQKTNLNKLN